MQQSELRALLTDCVRLWGAEVRLEVEEDGIALEGAGGRFVLREALANQRPARWVLRLPDGRTRMLPSITAVLTTLRNGLVGGADAAE